MDLSGGRTQFAKFMDKAFITNDGKAIEGAAAGEVAVMGKVTYFFKSTDAEDECPV